MKISIVGDSFSSDYSDTSWVSLLSSHFEIANFSQRGISQYRIFQIIKNNLQFLVESDAIIVFHTNPDRVFIPDSVEYPTRTLKSHPWADMIASDVLIRRDWRAISKTYYRYFFDFAFQKDLFDFIVKDLSTLLNGKPILHCTGHDITCHAAELKSFNDLFLSNPGSVNHLDSHANKLVFDYMFGKLMCIKIQN